MKIAIADDFIESVTPCIPIQWWMRYDVLPFLIIYSTLFSLSLSKSTFHIALFGIPSILLLHNLIFLLSQWSFSIKMKLGYSEVRNIEQAQFVFVKARKNMGKDKVEPLYRRNRRGQANIIIGGTKFDFNILFFQFQNILYSYSVEDQSFKRELYPTSGRIGDFVEHKGHSNEDMLMNCLQKWGFNVFEIPIPLFLDLYIENLTAPFFVFQVLCLVLWSLDDYWYYSVLTLFMLMLFEGMMCRQRQNSLLMLREMRRPPITLYVFRGGQWLSGTSDELVPGDVISLATSGSATVKMKRDQRKAPVEDLVLPCDALIIKGSCVVNEAMLTGESVPQIKESLENADIGSDLTATIDVGFENNTDSSWRRHVVLGGTSLLQHAAASSEETMTDIDSSSLDMDHPVVKLTKNGLPLSPDRGCTAIVLRTGFATVQGGLMRKILFAKERVNVNEMETYRFIGVLVIFAAIASGVVLVQGLKDANRNNFKLILHCIMIITSVVPPELPMELSLAITNSLAALARGLVYCTEPFRLPYAGKLDVLCFDKTGTLTQDKMFLKGVVIASHMKAQDSETSLGQIFQDNGSLAPTTGPVVDMVIDPVSVTNASILVSTAMASCHSLILKDATNSASFVGDPLEIVTLEATGFQFDTATQATASHASSRLILPSFLSADKSVKLVLKHRYPFNSTLKRMSVLTEVTLKPEVYYYSSVTNSVTGLFLFTKGAPEVLAPMIADLPADYKTVYLYHMSRGKRVLALAGKKIASSLLSQSVGSEIHKKMTTMIKSREVMETKLTFLGFLIFDCDIKPDSKSVIRELKESNHKLVMITGDSPYTATDVALRLGMVAKDKPTVILQTLLNRQGITNLIWRRADNLDNDGSEAKTDVVFDSRTITVLSQQYNLCVTGPGLHDVQAQHARYGSSYAWFTQISIFARVSPAQKESILRSLNDSGAITLMCGDGTNDVGALKMAHVGVSIVNDPEFESRIEANKAVKSNSKDRMSRALAELQEQENDPTIVKLGDASIASPFTSRRTSIDAVVTVVRQGRATLVTTVEVYKILALNCLVSAYMMSVLYLQGLKQGDMQMTVNGLISTGLFFFLSQAKPLQKISAHRPSTSVFSFTVIISIAGQFIVHFISLLATLYLSQRYSVGLTKHVSVDGKFQPDLVNSSVYILCTLMQINNFVMNYRGHPFTQSIQENELMWRSVQVLYVLLLIIVGGQLEPLNDFLQLAPFPSSDYQMYLIALLVTNTAAIYGVEKFSLLYE